MTRRREGPLESGSHRHAPVRARVRAALRSWIDDGTLAPGEPLDERELARRLDSSRTPVREALLALEGDGLVAPRPHGGFRAAPRSREEAEDLFRILGQLERRSLLRAGRPPAVDLARLEELDAARIDAPDAAARLSLERRWHGILLPARRIGLTARREIDRLQRRAARYEMDRLADGPHVLGAIEEHRGIVDALVDYRVAVAARLLERHWLGGLAHVEAERSASPDGSAAVA